MAISSNIEWTDSTWNPITGCTKISPGCKHCYAETFAERFRGVPGHPFEQGFDLRLWPERLDLPLKWKQPRIIFVNSMSDLFHERVSADFIFKVFETMQAAHWHKFQILTKRSERLRRLARTLPWPTNVWMGVSVESPTYTFRIDDLRDVPSAVRFLSIEPLLAEIPGLDLDGIDWVIVGGESGPKCRPMDAEWVRRIRRECKSQKVPFFFKQWGGTRKKLRGRMLDGRTWDEMPVAKMRVRPLSFSQSISSLQQRQSASAIPTETA